jgi:hypothetical protein
MDLGLWSLAYLHLHKFEHLHNRFVFKQDLEASPIWRFAKCDVFGFQGLQHGLSLSALFSAFEWEVRNTLFPLATLPAACFIGFANSA